MRTMVITGLALALAGCAGISKDQYTAKEAELARYQKLYGDEVNKSAALDVELTAAQARIKEIEEEKATAPAVPAAPAASAASSTPADTSAQREKLSQALERHIKTGQVDLSEAKGKLTVKVKDRILFPPGLAVLGKDGRKVLDAVADAFRGLRDRNVLVTGYTDNVKVPKAGPYKDNWDLSTARAIAVVRYLAFRGVDPAMLGAAGFSQYRPVAPNDTAANRSLNRRIEIALSASDYVPPTAEGPKKEVPRR